MKEVAFCCLKIILLALAYYAAGKLSLLLAIPPGFATPVWPAAGIALAGILVWGYRCLPGVFIGSFATNLLIASQAGADITNITPILVGAGIAIGAVLQTTLAAYLVKRVLILPNLLDKPQNTLSLLARGGLVGCLVNALCGPLVLLMAGVIPSSVYLVSAFTWWAGDVIGVVLFTPMLLLLANKNVSFLRKASVSVPILMFAVLTIFLFFNAKEDQQDKRQAQFDSVAQSITAEFKKDLASYLNILSAIEHFIKASNEVSYEEFAIFTKGFLEQYPSLQSLSWNAKVMHEDRKRFTQYIQNQDFPNFTIKDRFGVGKIEPAEKRDVYFPVSYMMPYEGNEAAHGYDTYGPDKITNNVRRRVLDQARDEGRPIMTGRISLVQAEDQYGLLIYNPVYSNELKDSTILERRSYHIGYTAGVFTMPSMMKPIAELANAAGVDVVLQDLDVSYDRRLLYDSRTLDFKERKAPIVTPAYVLSTVVNFYVAGHQWELQFIQKTEAVVRNQGWDLWFLLIGGLLFSAVFGMFLLIISASTENIQKEIEGVKQKRRGHNTAPFWFSGVSAAIIMLFSVILWQQFKGQEEKLLRSHVNEEIEVITQGLSNHIDNSVIALRRMAQRWESAKGTPKDQWLFDAKNYVEDFTALTTVEWVDDTYHVRWIEPLEGNEKAIGLDIAFNEERQKALEGAAEENKITMTPPLDLVQGYRAFITYVPIHIDRRFDGFMVGVFNTDVFLKTILSSEQIDNFNVLIMDGEKTVFQNTKEAITNHSFAIQKSLKLFNRQWTVTVSPKDIYIDQHKSFLSEIAFLGGLLFSILVSFSIYTAIISNQRSQLLRNRTTQLQESETRISLILDNAGEGVFGLDLNGCATFANKAATRILGYSREEMIGISQHDLVHHTYPDGEPYKREDCNVYAAFKDGKVHTEDKEVFWHKDGHAIPVEYTSAPIRDDQGNLSGAVVVFKDITERREYENALKQANEELEEFAYRTSHDLRSPLVSSIGLLEVARAAITDGDQSVALEGLDHTQKSLKKLETLVRDILDLTQIKNFEESDQDIDPTELIHEALEKFAHLENFGRLNIQKDLRFEGSVCTKKSRLTLIVENLISNAIKYQDLKKENSFVKISTNKQEGHFIFTVEDNGLGIPEEQQSKLFAMFKRFHGKVSFGSGLGLYMVKKSADILKGEVSFEDSGQSTVFNLKIPID